MEIILKKIEGINIAKIKGNLDTNTAPEAEAELNKLIEEAGSKLILNLEETQYVSSAGLRVFLATAKRLTARGGVFKLCKPNDVVKEILDISGFSTILDVKETENEAIQEM